MKIVIHGTKGGYHTFTPDNVKMIDARPDFNKVAAIGQQAYSINFTDGNVVFSKYRIIRDVAGEKRTGNIAFSVFIPYNEKMLGIDIKDFLDKLSEEYYLKYIPDNNNNLYNIREDWSFISSLKSQYQDQIKMISPLSAKDFTQGNGEAAFVYYFNELELCRHFDTPFQKVYNAYKQVFFVEMRLKDAPENPLNALRHDPNANLTGQVDLSIRKVLEIVALVYKDGNNITNFELKAFTEHKTIHGDGMQLIFKNDDINQSWQISVKHTDYHTWFFDYKPEEDYKKEYVRLEKKLHLTDRGRDAFTQNPKKYRIVIDENKGIRSPGLNIYPFVYEYPYYGCKARFGYKFVGWKLVDIPNNGYTGDYEAVFKKAWYSKFSNWAWILLFSAIIAVSYILIFTKVPDYPRNIQSKDLSQISNTINAYVFGIELNLDTLKKIYSTYCIPRIPASYNESEKGFWHKILPFISKNSISSSQQPPPMQDLCRRISYAIAMREAINRGQIDNLIGKAYSKEQEQFKMAIEEIDNSFKNEIVNTLLSNPVSDMNLNEVAQLIRDKQVELYSQRKRSQEAIKQNETAKNRYQQRDFHEQATPSQQTNESSLVKEFWELVRKRDTPQMNYYRHLFDKYFQNSKIIIPNPTDEEQEIISFLQEICKNSRSFGTYAKDIPAIDRLQAKSVAELRNLKNQTK